MGTSGRDGLKRPQLAAAANAIVFLFIYCDFVYDGLLTASEYVGRFGRGVWLGFEIIVVNVKLGIGKEIVLASLINGRRSRVVRFHADHSILCAAMQHL